ncbi:MAG: hypothetical protein U0521_21265 [Anaerolineae bacterium]
MWGLRALNAWWAAHRGHPARVRRSAQPRRDCYLVVNGDLSVTVVPPHVVEPMIDGAGVVVGWRITERTEDSGLRTENLTPDPSPLRREGRQAQSFGTITIVDEYTAAGRVRRVMRGSVTVRTEHFANLTGVIPVIHVANRWGADEFYGRPEGDALIPALQRYGDVIDAAIRGNIRQGRPTPVIEKMGTAEQVRKFWEKFGRRETQTLPDGSRRAVDVIDFDPDQLPDAGRRGAVQVCRAGVVQSGYADAAERAVLSGGATFGNRKRCGARRSRRAGRAPRPRCSRSSGGSRKGAGWRKAG